MYKIIDTAQVTTQHIPQLRAAGVTSVIRYLSAINPTGEKCVKEAEARALAAAGIRLALVNEGWGDFAHGGISADAGRRDGQFCAKYAPTVGAPAGAVIFFAVDVDATHAQIQQLVLPYFSAIKQAMGGTYQVGVYGSGAVCAAVVGAGLADVAWLACSTGWAGSKSYLAEKPKQLVLVQHLPTTIANLSCDPDEALGEFGDFLPFQISPLPQTVPADHSSALPVGGAVPSSDRKNRGIITMNSIVFKLATQWALNRLGEGTTWAGIWATLQSSYGIILNPHIEGNLQNAGMLIVGAILIGLKEGWHQTAKA